jgi:ribonuclease P protein component
MDSAPAWRRSRAAPCFLADALAAARSCRPSNRAVETLKSRAEFQRVQKGRKWAMPAFILQGLARPGKDDEPPRFGFTVSSKAVSKESSGAKRRGMAVDRNRARRRLKEAVRLTFPDHAALGCDYVIIGRAAAMTRNFAALLADMRIAFHKVHQPARSGKDRDPSP